MMVPATRALLLVMASSMLLPMAVAHQGLSFNEANGQISLQIDSNGQVVNVDMKGSETGVYFQVDGYDVEVNLTDCNGVDCSSFPPAYSLPNDTSSCTKMSYGLFLLLPTEIRQPLLNAFPLLDTVATKLAYRLDQILPMNITAQGYWNDHIDDVPTVTEFFTLVDGLIQGGLERLRQIGAGADVEWLIGSNTACAGMTKAQKAASGNALCNGGLLNQVCVNVTRRVDQEQPGIFGGALDDDEDDNTTAGRVRRSSCTRTNPFDPFTFDNYGPSTTNEADYRIRRVLVVPIRFSDHANRNVPTRDQLEEIFNCRGGCSMAAQSGSVRDFWMEGSYYRNDVVATVLDWVDLSYTETYYSGNYYGISGTALRRLCTYGFKVALQSIATNYPTMNLRQFAHDCNDMANNGLSYTKVTDVLFITSGYPAEYSSSGSPYRIWSHQTSFSNSYCGTSSGMYITNPSDGTSIKFQSYMVTNGCFGDGGDGDSCPNKARLGVIVHEQGHGYVLNSGLRIQDYYETTTSDTTLPTRCGSSGSGSGIDAWGIMGDSWGPTNDQRYPPGMSVWSRVQHGYIDPIVVSGTSSQQFELWQSAQCPDALKITQGYASSNEFLLVENRQRVAYDSGLPGSGVAVFHIDQSLTARNSKPTWSNTNAHYYYRLEQKDGGDNLECGGSGDSGDLLGTGQSVGSSSLSSYPYKSTHGYWQNNEVVTNTEIKAVSFGTNGQTATVNYTYNGVSATSAPIYRRPTTCSAGHYGTLSGTCIACPVGKYNPKAGAPCNSACQICPDGTYTDSTGSTSCTPCPAGTYDDITIYPSDSNSCVTCNTNSMTVSTVPLLQKMLEYCNNNGAFTSYSGGAYNEYNQRDIQYITDEQLFLGLTKEQLMYIMYAGIAVVVLLIFQSAYKSHSLHKKKAAKYQRVRMIRAGHGYGAGQVQANAYYHGHRGAPPRMLSPEDYRKMHMLQQAAATQQQQHVPHMKQMQAAKMRATQKGGHDHHGLKKQQQQQHHQQQSHQQQQRQQLTPEQYRQMQEMRARQIATAQARQAGGHHGHHGQQQQQTSEQYRQLQAQRMTAAQHGGHGNHGHHGQQQQQQQQHHQFQQLTPEQYRQMQEMRARQIAAAEARHAGGHHGRAEDREHPYDMADATPFTHQSQA